MAKRAPQTFKVEMTTRVDSTATRIADVLVRGLEDRDWDDNPTPDTEIYVGGVLEYRAEYLAQCLADPDFVARDGETTPHFYAGIHERRYEKLEDAVCFALYDLFQIRDDLVEGDIFEFTDHNGAVSRFIAIDVHVVPTGKADPAELLRLLAGRVLS